MNEPETTTDSGTGGAPVSPGAHGLASRLAEVETWACCMEPERRVRAEWQRNQAVGLLRGWVACMAGPRPSDWEEIVENLLVDTQGYLRDAR